MTDGPSVMNRSLGFTLVELAIVLVVLGLLLGGLLMPLATQIDIVRIKETNDALDKVQEALLGFAIASPNNRLPCPDTQNNDGLEDWPCTPVTEGDLPWRTLGVGRFDAWGRTFRYHPDGNFVNTVGFPPDTAGQILVQDRGRTQLTPFTNCASPNGNGPAAIVFSLGKNGVADEENAVSNSCPSAHVYTQDTYVEGTYDDILIWLSKNILVSRLTAAGTWPP